MLTTEQDRSLITETETQPFVHLRLHHLTSLYYTFCLTPEEQARTPMFNDANVYGERFARATQAFYQNTLNLPDAFRIRIVGSLDEVCIGCPKENDFCRLEDKQDDYEVPRLLGIDVEDVITLGELKEKMKELYPRHDASWKDRVWEERLAKHPHLAKYTVANYWLYLEQEPVE